MTDEKQVRYDVDGFEVVTAALRELVNQFPGLPAGDEIAFATLGEDSGKAMFPVSGAVIETEKEDITGHVTQICLYPFAVIYRVGGPSENRKANIKELLDDLGRWLNRQPVQIDGALYQLEEYPRLTEGRKFLSFDRQLQTPGYLENVNESSEDWTIYITARYRNEFNR